MDKEKLSPVARYLAMTFGRKNFILRLRRRNAFRSLGNLILALILAEQTLTRRVLKKLAQPVFSELNVAGWPCGFLVKFLNFIGLKYVKVNLEFGDLYIAGPEAVPRAIIMMSEKYEPDIQSIFSRIKPTNVVVDVGAHLGYYTLKFSKIASKVIAIEPHPNNFYWLQRNLKLNRVHNVRPIKAAISDQNARAKLYITSWSGGHSLLDKDQQNGYINVRTLTIDTLLNKMGIEHVDLLKVDVEGGELLVLKGAINSLPKVNHIILEIHNRNEEELRNILLSYGFKVHLLSSYHLYGYKVAVRAHS